MSNSNLTKKKCTSPLRGRFRKHPVLTTTEALGAFFRYKRLQSGFSEQEISRYLGLSSAFTLRAYEAGKTSIPMNHVYALSNCLNVSPDEISELLHRLNPQNTP